MRLADLDDVLEQLFARLRDLGVGGVRELVAVLGQYDVDGVVAQGGELLVS